MLDKMFNKVFDLALIVFIYAGGALSILGLTSLGLSAFGHIGGTTIFERVMLAHMIGGGFALLIVLVMLCLPKPKTLPRG